jgi:hypothetical protein
VFKKNRRMKQRGRRTSGAEGGGQGRIAHIYIKLYVYIEPYLACKNKSRKDVSTTSVSPPV